MCSGCFLDVSSDLTVFLSLSHAWAACGWVLLHIVKVVNWLTCPLESRYLKISWSLSLSAIIVKTEQALLEVLIGVWVQVWVSPAVKLFHNSVEKTKSHWILRFSLPSAAKNTWSYCCDGFQRPATGYCVRWIWETFHNPEGTRTTEAVDRSWCTQGSVLAFRSCHGLFVVFSWYFASYLVFQSHILAGRAVANILRTSLGPKGAAVKKWCELHVLSILCCWNLVLNMWSPQSWWRTISYQKILIFMCTILN